MIDTEFLKHLDRFNLILQRKVNSKYQGQQRSTETGSGLVLKDYVQYAPGDDFRRIDWKVFGRSDKLYVKRYEEERNLTVHVLVDSSGSMHFGKKEDYAGMIGLGYAYMALRNNERFVLSTFDEKLDVYRPSRGMKQIAAIVDYLNNKKATGVTEFEKTLMKYIRNRISTRSLVVIVSDFLYDREQIKNVLHRLHGHEVVLIQVLDKVEADLDLIGDFKLIDAETKKTMRAFISPFLKKKYKGEMARHQAHIKDTCDEVGARFFVVNTGEDIFDVFYKLMGR